MTIASLVLLGASCSTTTGSTSPSTEPLTTVPTTIEIGEPEAAPSTTDGQAAGATSTLGLPPTTEPLSDWLAVELDFRLVAEASFPIDLVARSGTEDLYLAEKTGRVKRLAARGSGDFSVDEDLVLNLSGEVSGGPEQGLLGLAFSPDGSLLFVNYTDRSGNSVVEEFTMSEPPGESGEADVSTRRIVMEVDQPFSNHNGGGLTFGPDGYLYVGFGDGGRAGDPLDSGQQPKTFLGSMLRIDPLGGDPYAVPADNPFAGSAQDVAPETWLYGVRNPWRYSFDQQTGDLWIGDVGQDAFEEIDLLPAATGTGRAANLGWNLTEGNEGFRGASAPENHTAPIHAYAHRSRRCSVTGGFVYRGSDLPEFDGVYVFADFCSGEMFGLEQTDNDPRVERLSIALPAKRLVSFGQDAHGEIYILDIAGRVLRLANAVEP